jgi:5-methylcytosine-specific restriction endonuclease McrA
VPKKAPIYRRPGTTAKRLGRDASDAWAWLYKTARWRKCRLAFLASSPLCVRCLVSKRTRAATVVDHVVPHQGDEDLFWDERNWQPLCKFHHDHKTATEDHGLHGKGGPKKQEPPPSGP